MGPQFEAWQNLWVRVYLFTGIPGSLERDNWMDGKRGFGCRWKVLTSRLQILGA
jgi:hypothetical protein